MGQDRYRVRRSRSSLPETSCAARTASEITVVRRCRRGAIGSSPRHSRVSGPSRPPLRLLLEQSGLALGGESLLFLALQLLDALYGCRQVLGHRAALPLDRVAHFLADGVGHAVGRILARNPP